MDVSLEYRVREVMASSLMVEFDELKPQVDLVEHLYLDSLDLLDLMMTLNEAFGIEVTAPDLRGAKTVADVCRMVERKLVQPSAVVPE